MSILLNGIPKSGTHVLQRVVEIKGIPFKSGVKEDGTRAHGIDPGAIAYHGHVPYEARDAVLENFHRHIFIKRNLRNVVISWMYHNKSERRSLENAFEHFHTGAKYPNYVRRFVDWNYDVNTHVVKFEDLIYNRTGLEEIYELLQLPFDSTDYDAIIGGTRTYREKHANWRKEWTSTMEYIWYETGMPELNRLLGYDDDE